MDTQTFVTYEIVESATGKRFDVNEEYLAQYYYREGDRVTEKHTTFTLSPPYNRTIVQVIKVWHDKDPDNDNHESETEIEEE